MHTFAVLVYHGGVTGDGGNGAGNRTTARRRDRLVTLRRAVPFLSVLSRPCPVLKWCCSLTALPSRSTAPSIVVRYSLLRGTRVSLITRPCSGSCDCTVLDAHTHTHLRNCVRKARIPWTGSVSRRT